MKRWYWVWVDEHGPFKIKAGSIEDAAMLGAQRDRGCVVETIVVTPARYFNDSPGFETLHFSRQRGEIDREGRILKTPEHRLIRPSNLPKWASVERAIRRLWARVC